GENAEESPYVLMTSELAKVFPHQGGAFQIEPDASSGSYFWAAGTLEPIGAPQTEGRSSNSRSQATCTTVTGRWSVWVANWPQTGWQIDANFPGAYTLLESQTVGFLFGEEGMFGTQKKSSAVAGPVVISRQSDLGDSIM